MSPELRHITLTREDDWWVARDDDTGIASQGETRGAALEHLDKAVRLSNAANEADTPTPVPDAPWFDSS